MKKYITTSLVAIMLATGCSTISTASNKLAPDNQTGAIKGAAAGGIIGGILGKNIGMFFSRPVARRTTEGIIGGAVGGAILGGLLGASNKHSQAPSASGEGN